MTISVRSMLVPLVIMIVPAVQAEGEWSWEPAFRYRAQSVEDVYQGDAFASTVKGRLTAQYLHEEAWTVKASVDHVYAFNEGHYNDIVVHRPTSPIPDPSGTELSELSVLYQLNTEWGAWMGRLPLIQDDERHVGTQEFWQKRQTFDGVQLHYDTALNSSFSYTYLHQVNRFFGRTAKSMLQPDDPLFASNPLRSPEELGVHQHRSHLLHGRYSLSGVSSISAYLYMLNNETLASLSSNTFGLRYQLSVKPDKLKYELTLETALQQDAGNNTADYQASYLFAEAKLQYKSHHLSLSHEHLGADNHIQFATSLGSNHKFQGWADVFSGYGSSQGLNDSVVSYGGRQGKLRWKFDYHVFFDTSFAQHIANELDIEVAYRFNRKWEAKLALADYQARDGIPPAPQTRWDVTTVFASLSYNL